MHNHVNYMGGFEKLETNVKLATLKNSQILWQFLASYFSITEGLIFR